MAITFEQTKTGVAQINSGAAAAGTLLAADGAGGAAWETTLVVDTANGRVGIGTTSPLARLGVIGADSLNTSFASNISGATGTGLVVTNAGNVGIGTTNPGEKLTVSNAGNTTTQVEHANVGWFRIKNTTTGNYWHMENNYGGNNDLRFGTSVGNGKITFLSNGNVGIGTTGPTAALHLPASSTTRATLRIVEGTAPTAPNTGDVWTAGGKIYYYNGSATKEVAFV